MPFKVVGQLKEPCYQITETVQPRCFLSIYPFSHLLYLWHEIWEHWNNMMKEKYPHFHDLDHLHFGECFSVHEHSNSHQTGIILTLFYNLIFDIRVPDGRIPGFQGAQRTSSWVSGVSVANVLCWDDESEMLPASPHHAWPYPNFANLPFRGQ